MSEFQSRPEHSTGHNRWFWKNDGDKTNWKLDVLESQRSRRESDLDDGRLVHYMRIGAIRSDIEEEKNRVIPPDRRSIVVKWLVALALFWIVFRIVRL